MACLFRLHSAPSYDVRLSDFLYALSIGFASSPHRLIFDIQRLFYFVFF